MEMTDNLSVLYLGPGTVVGLHGFLITEDVHADWAVWKVLLRMPSVKMSHQVVFLVEVEGANKTAELCLFLVM